MSLNADPSQPSGNSGYLNKALSFPLFVYACDQTAKANRAGQSSLKGSLAMAIAWTGFEYPSDALKFSYHELFRKIVMSGAEALASHKTHQWTKESSIVTKLAIQFCQSALLSLAESLWEVGEEKLKKDGISKESFIELLTNPEVVKKMLKQSIISGSSGAVSAFTALKAKSLFENKIEGQDPTPVKFEIVHEEVTNLLRNAKFSSECAKWVGENVAYYMSYFLPGMASAAASGTSSQLVKIPSEYLLFKAELPLTTVVDDVKKPFKWLWIKEEDLTPEEAEARDECFATAKKIFKSACYDAAKSFINDLGVHLAQARLSYNERAKLKKELAQDEKKIEKLNKQIDDLKQQVAALLKECEDNDAAWYANQNKIDDLENKIAALEESLNREASKVITELLNDALIEELTPEQTVELTRLQENLKKAEENKAILYEQVVVVITEQRKIADSLHEMSEIFFSKGYIPIIDGEIQTNFQEQLNDWREFPKNIKEFNNLKWQAPPDAGDSYKEDFTEFKRQAESYYACENAQSKSWDNYWDSCNPYFEAQKELKNYLKTVLPISTEFQDKMAEFEEKKKGIQEEYGQKIKETENKKQANLEDCAKRLAELKAELAESTKAQETITATQKEYREKLESFNKTIDEKLQLINSLKDKDQRISDTVNQISSLKSEAQIRIDLENELNSLISSKQQDERRVIQAIEALVGAGYGIKVNREIYRNYLRRTHKDHKHTDSGVIFSLMVGCAGPGTYGKYCSYDYHCRSDKPAIPLYTQEEAPPTNFLGQPKWVRVRKHPNTHDFKTLLNNFNQAIENYNNHQYKTKINETKNKISEHQENHPSLLNDIKWWESKLDQFSKLPEKNEVEEDIKTQEDQKSELENETLVDLAKKLASAETTAKNASEEISNVEKEIEAYEKQADLAREASDKERDAKINAASSEFNDYLSEVPDKFKAQHPHTQEIKDCEAGIVESKEAQLAATRSEIKAENQINSLRNSESNTNGELNKAQESKQQTLAQIHELNQADKNRRPVPLPSSAFVQRSTLGNLPSSPTNKPLEKLVAQLFPGTPSERVPFKALVLRGRIVQHMKNHQNDLREFSERDRTLYMGSSKKEVTVSNWKEYFDRMVKEGTWITSRELQVLAEIENVEIVVTLPPNERRYIHKRRFSPSTQEETTELRKISLDGATVGLHIT